MGGLAYNILRASITQQTKELYIIANVLKYKSVDLIIFYCCTYSKLSGIMKVVIWNSIKLMRNTRFGSQIDR